MNLSLPEPVYIAGLGASTPIGRDAWSTAAAVRAGISGFAEHPYMIDSAGEPMKIALARWLDPGYEGLARFEQLLLPALDQTVSPFSSTWGRRIRIELAVGFSSVRPGLPQDLERGLRTTIRNRFGDRLAEVHGFGLGHAAGFFAMQDMWRRISAGDLDAAIVAGVESYNSPDTLEWLEQNDQLHGAGPLNNAWGFVPGEAAGAALLVSGTTLAHLGMDPLGQVLSVGTGYEPNRIKTETVCIGHGLTAAFREGLTGLPSGAKVTDVYCDMNGEPYRADEFGFACLRTKEAFESASDFVAPADCWGDISAASAPLAIALSTIAARKSYANGRFSFLWASSESGERGAALLEVSPGS